MRSSPPWLKTYINSSGSASMAVSNIVGTRREIVQFGTSVFVEAQEINLWGTLEVNMMNIAYFHNELFSFYEKVPSPIDPVGFVSKRFYPYYDFNWCSWVDNMTM